MATDAAPVFKEEREYEGHTSSVYGVAISPDGTLVASAENGGTFLLVEISSGAHLYTFNHDESLWGVCWAPDGMRLWVSGDNGAVIEVSRSANGGQWSHKTVYEHTASVNMLTYVPVFDLLALPCDDNCLVLVDVKTDEAIQTIPLEESAWCVACNASGSLLFVGCYDGTLCALSRKDSGAYDKVGEVMAHKDTIYALSLNSSGSLLLTGSLDKTASLWRIASSFLSFEASPLMTFKGHEDTVYGAALTGDEQFALTGSHDKTIRIWRVGDGAEVGKIPCKWSVDSISFHAASGALAVGLLYYGVAILRCAPHAPSPPLPAAAPIISSMDRRIRKPLAAAALSTIQGRIASFDPAVRAAADREHELVAEIARLEDRLARAEKELASLRTADFIKKRDELAKLLEQEQALENEMSACDHVLRELDENTKMPSCLGHLHSEGFEQWLHDIGLAHTIEHLKGLDGEQLKSFLVADVEGMGLSFADSSSLLLRAYLTHHRASPAPHFAPPPGLLCWDAATTSTWLTSLGHRQLASLGWNGPSLCSLNYPRVRTMMNIAAFNELSARIRGQLASEGAPQWAQSWSALSIIGN